ncbi:uncharacterized protein LOC142768954 [Rhipicephalus microplus]|uniref:uncharacterized protein LOC142768954 n=1 Tax=Rhipicephalus microplus TaxID=6941 RepID=UPI003F6C17BF
MSCRVHPRVPGGALAKKERAEKRARGWRPRRQTKQCAAREAEFLGAFLSWTWDPYVSARLSSGVFVRGRVRRPVQGARTGPAERLLPGCSGREQVRGEAYRAWSS